MSFVNQKSFAAAINLAQPLNVTARTALLSQIDQRMQAYAETLRSTLVACPEHLFSTDNIAVVVNQAGR